MQRDPDLLNDILIACQLIQDFLLNFDLDSFSEDPKTQSAVLHQLLIIGEASNKISQQTKDGMKEIPWKEVIGMRNKLIHDYNSVDIDLVWSTCKNEIPSLVEKIDSFIS